MARRKIEDRVKRTTSQADRIVLHRSRGGARRSMIVRRQGRTNMRRAIEYGIENGDE